MVFGESKQVQNGRSKGGQMELVFIVIKTQIGMRIFTHSRVCLTWTFPSGALGGNTSFLTGMSYYAVWKISAIDYQKCSQALLKEVFKTLSCTEPTTYIASAGFTEADSEAKMFFRDSLLWREGGKQDGAERIRLPQSLTASEAVPHQYSLCGANQIWKVQPLSVLAFF